MFLSEALYFSIIFGLIVVEGLLLYAMFQITFSYNKSGDLFGFLIAYNINTGLVLILVKVMIYIMIEQEFYGGFSVF